MQGINVFATTTARDAAITAPAEGQFAFTKDTNSLWYYDGAAWVASGAAGDIEGVTAGVGISGGGTSGTVTVTNSMATAIDAKGDLVPGTGADTFARLAVGANGTVLTADSAEVTGLKWSTPGGGSAATPTALGTVYGKTSATLTDTLGVGYNSALVATGTGNTGVGNATIKAVTSGAYNTGVGYRAVEAVITGGSNTGVGAFALYKTTGSDNTAVGTSTCGAVTTGSNNVGVGSNALTSTTTGSNNTAIGTGALSNNTTGGSNVAVGHDLLAALVTGGSGNTAVGEGNLISLTSGNYNVAIGQTCLESQTSASYNVAIGNNAGTGTGGGSNNIYIGNTIRSSSGADVTNIGPGTGNVSATYTNVTNIGHDAAASSTTASNTITLGDANITSLRCQVTSITSLSDERDKKDIQTLDVGLDFINTLKPVSFQWNMRPKLDDEGNVISTGKVDIPDIGFIAQDMVKAEDDLGLAEYLQLSYRDNPEALEVSQGRLIPILVKAIQDLTAKVEALENAATEL
jgi:hypothetical protein